MENYTLMAIGGLIAGLFGSVLGLGGGILILPMLTLVFGVPIKEAVGTSLICVIATSSGAASLYVKKHIADIRLGMTLELATTIGAIVGGLVAGFIKPEVLAILFSLLLLYVAFSLIRKKAVGDPALRPFDKLRVLSRVEAQAQGGDSSASLTVPEQGRRERSRTTKGGEENSEGASSIRKDYQITNLPLGMGASFFAGNISGLLGVGGGVIKVPTMYLLMRVPLKIASATSNFMIGVTATAGAFVYYARGEVDLLVTGVTMIGVFFGALIGSRVLHLIKAEYLKKAFIIVLLYLSVEMLFKGLNLHFLF